MNTLRTVFAFVVLVVAVAFLSAALIMMTQTDNWRKKHDELETATAQKISDLESNIRDLTKERDDALVKRDEWQKEVDRLTLALGGRDSEIKGLTNEKAKLEEFKSSMTDEMRLIRAKQDELHTKNNELTKSKDDAVDAKKIAIEAQRKAEDDLRSAEADVLNLRRQLQISQVERTSAVELNQRYFAVYKEDGIRLAQAAPAPVPRINGQVTSADNPMRLVAISVGKDDGVRVGMTFEVVRPDAQEYVGRVRVLEVQDEESICRIDGAMTVGPIRKDDRVTTSVQ